MSIYQNRQYVVNLEPRMDMKVTMEKKNNLKLQRAKAKIPINHLKTNSNVLLPHAEKNSVTKQV